MPVERIAANGDHRDSTNAHTPDARESLPPEPIARSLVAKKRRVLGIMEEIGALLEAPG